MGIKICLGNEHDLTAIKRVRSIQETFDPSEYKITCDGFLINDYYVEFVDESSVSLYYLKCT